MQQNNVKSQFNVNAEKLVSVAELKQRVNTLYKQGLSTSEKIRLNVVHKPISAFQGIATAWAALRDTDETSVQIYRNLYKDPFENGYMNGTAMNGLLKKSLSGKVNNAFQAKINRLSVQAFEECQDYSKDDVLKSMLQRMKP